MVLEKEVNKLCLNSFMLNDNISSWMEQDIVIPDTKPDAIKIINVIVNPYITNTEVMDNIVKVDGKLNYYIIYKTNETDMGTRGLFMSIPYTENLKVKGINKDYKVYVTPMVKNVIYSLPNERKVSTKTEVIFKVRGHKNLEVCVISNFLDNNIETKRVSADMNNIILEKTNIISSREDIILPKENDDMYEILKVDSRINNTEYKESYNKIIIRGDITCDIIYIANNKEVKKCNIEIPFTSMIELESINDKSKFEIDYVLTNFNISPNMDIDSIKTMNCDYRIDSNILMYEEVNVEYIDDFYSQRYELDYTDNRVDVVKNMSNNTYQIEINEKINDVLEDNYRIIDIMADPSYIVLKESNDKLHVEGNLKLSVLKQNMANMEIENKIMDILVNEEIDIDCKGCNFKLVVDKVTFSSDNSELDIKVKMSVHARCYNNGKIKSACDIESKNIDLKNFDSMNIYIVKQGDTLWSIAKKYKTSLEKIKSINNLVDENEISINQKLLIIR